ncbi:hypothetical protein Tco_0520981 [Tanacetum coccineum]
MNSWCYAIAGLEVSHMDFSCEALLVYLFGYLYLEVKRRLAKNNEAKMVIYNALPRKEYKPYVPVHYGQKKFGNLLSHIKAAPLTPGSEKTVSFQKSILGHRPKHIIVNKVKVLVASDNEVKQFYKPLSKLEVGFSKPNSRSKTLPPRRVNNNYSRPKTPQPKRHVGRQKPTPGISRNLEQLSTSKLHAYGKGLPFQSPTNCI